MLADESEPVRLTVPLTVGTSADEVAIEAGHLERLFRVATFVAVRDGVLGPAEDVVARLLPGAIRARHGEVHCLESCVVELRRTGGEMVCRVAFGCDAFATFALARAAHRLPPGAPPTDRFLSYSLHAHACDDAPAPVVVPTLPILSVESVAPRAMRWGASPDGWIDTVVTPAAATGLAELEQSTRASGHETAGRIHTRIAFDPARRCFVRVLDRVVVAHGAPATAVTVRSPAASWGEFLSTRPTCPSVTSSVHTHVHLLAACDADGIDAEPCISVSDVMTHYVHFPDPLSAALIVSVFADRADIRLFGYSPGAVLREESGWWLALEDVHA